MMHSTWCTLCQDLASVNSCIDDPVISCFQPVLNGTPYICCCLLQKHAVILLRSVCVQSLESVLCWLEWLQHLLHCSLQHTQKVSRQCSKVRRCYNSMCFRTKTLFRSSRNDEPCVLSDLSARAPCKATLCQAMSCSVSEDAQSRDRSSSRQLVQHKCEC